MNDSAYLPDPREPTTYDELPGRDLIVKLLASLLLLISVSAFGAVPAYTSFRGSGGITIVSNPPTGTIVIDGSGVVATGTNSSINSSVNGTNVTAGATNLNLVAGTNIVLNGTNMGSTAHIGIALAPNVSIPGTFEVGGAATFLDVALFNNFAVFNATMTINSGASNGFVLTSDVSGNATWRPPTGSVTNIGVGQTIYLDAAFGNDATASRTNLLRPSVSASNAVNLIQSGDTLRVRGGTYLVPPKAWAAAEFPGLNTSGALAITNKNNIRIVGEPGSVFRMAAQARIGATSSCPMFVLSRCTNVIIEGLTLEGIRTNNAAAYSGQDFAIMFDQCDGWTVKNCVISNWQNQGITDLSFTTVNRNWSVEDCKFYDIGNSNHATLGVDGAAISVGGTNVNVARNEFWRCFRDFELCCNQDNRRVRFVDNWSFLNRKQVLDWEATNIQDVVVSGNQVFGYSTNLLSASEATFLYCFGLSNAIVRDNFVAGAIGVWWASDQGRSVYDVTIRDNTFLDALFNGVFMARSVGASTLNVRTSIERNHFLNCFTTPIRVSGDDLVIKDNVLTDCNYATDPQGVISLGSRFSTENTNVNRAIVTGNILNQSIVVANTTGIVMYALNSSNVVFGNIVSRNFQGGILDLGSGTRTRPVNLIGPGKILTTDTNSDEVGLTVGPNLVNTGGVLSVNTNPVFNTVTANNFGNTILVLLSNICATVVTVSGNTNIVIVTNSVPGHTDYNVSGTGTGGSGTPGGNPGAIQFNHAGAFAGTNNLNFDRANITLTIYNQVSEAGLHLYESGIYELSDTGLKLGLNAFTNAWEITGSSTSFASLVPGASNVLSVGLSLFPASNVWANVVHAKESMDVGLDSGLTGLISLYDTAGIASGLGGMTMVRGVTNLPWTDTNTGVVTAYRTAAGVNQLTNIALAAGQYVTYNGTGYVASNLPSAGSSETNLISALQVYGLGTNWNIRNTDAPIVFGGTNLSFSLSAGTYLMNYTIVYSPDIAGSLDVVFSYLWNETDSVKLSVNSTTSGIAAGGYVTLHGNAIVVLSGTKTVGVWAVNSTSARGLIAGSYQNSKLNYVRLY